MECWGSSFWQHWNVHGLGVVTDNVEGVVDVGLDHTCDDVAGVNEIDDDDAVGVFDAVGVADADGVVDAVGAVDAINVGNSDAVDNVDDIYDLGDDPDADGVADVDSNAVDGSVVNGDAVGDGNDLANVNGTAHFKKCKLLFEYQHTLT